ncbi:unnamed protein product [Caenorhabditis angaria]|uniref:N-alpha-acetyltransferase 40 n=1 Tax=Caenorhabditis angaria TaxID=860376 RepID=A0A9P1ITE7_9PELO|nr:unnamed protein product [Caenorhabditis angaria]
MADKAKKLVKKASQQMNPVEKFQCLTDDRTSSDGEEITFKYAWATHLTDEEFDWVFSLFKQNMFTMYQMSQWGWDADSKKNELRATTARYIIALNSKGEKIGYTHYRFVLDHGIPALYCYEIQVIEDYQKKGVGSMLMRTLESLAEKTFMEKVLATVFAYNEKSLAFFHKNDYTSDVTCPDEDQGLDYLILSKGVQI